MDLTTVQHILPGNSYTCFVIPSLFLPIECAELLNEEIKSSFQKATANYPTYYRNNERFVMDNEELSNSLQFRRRHLKSMGY